MASTHPKVMLKTILEKAVLKPHERELYDDLWDSIHRYGKLSRNQQHVIEKVFYGQKLDRVESAESLKAAPVTKPAVVGAGVPAQVGAIQYPGVTTEVVVTNIIQFQKTCPDITKGSKQYLKIENFFKRGGKVLKIKPQTKTEEA